MIRLDNKSAIRTIYKSVNLLIYLFIFILI